MSLRRLLLFPILALSATADCGLGPQPDPPGANLLVSATDEPGDVAVVGGAGCVPPGAGVRVTGEDGETADADAAENGAFVAVIRAAPGDRLAVSYFVWEGRELHESAAREVVVDDYDPADPPMVNDDGSPRCVGEYDAAGGFMGPPQVDPPVDGRARVWCSPECVEPNVRVVVANRETAVVVDTIHASGAFEASIPASIGDVLLVFAVRLSDERQASRVIELVVPAP